jgi:hypothetical protein
MNGSGTNAGERVKDVKCTKVALVVDLVDGRTISVPLEWFPRLAKATAAERSKWEIVAGGFGIHWPDVDEDFSAEGLLGGAPALRRSVP